MRPAISAKISIFALNVASINLPPLRERGEDILLLFYRLARQARARFRKDIPDVTPEIIAQLHAYDWPGNVRELRNSADRFVLGMGLGIDGSDLPVSGTPQEGTLPEKMAAYEKALIEREIERNGGSLKPTYESFGISRKALYEKMKKYGIQNHDAN